MRVFVFLGPDPSPDALRPWFVQEVEPLSVSFSKPLKRSGRVEQVMVDDLGPLDPDRRQNAAARFREGRR
jgi:hypothetical protein